MVAAHKEFPMPEDKNLYLPVLVGAEANYKSGINYQRDDDGNNISNKNPNYSELTAVYWAWKNLNNVDAVGLVHYRRLFSNGFGKKVISNDEVKKLLESYDVILPKKRKYYIETNYSHYIHAHHKEPLDELRKIIENNYPEYLESFDIVMSKRSAHMFNMFVMKRNYFDAYSKFIFGALNKLERKIDITDYSNQEARIYGYLSELLMDVWIIKNNIHYKEVNWIQIGKKHLVKKIFFFVSRKFGFNFDRTHF